MADLFAITDGAAPAVPFVVIEMACIPHGKGRPRSRIVFPKAGKPFVHVYTDAADVKYEEALAWKAKAAMKGRAPLADVALAIRMFAILPVPKSWSRRDRDAALAGTIMPTSRPDTDNYAKAIMDAFNGIVWKDDAQVVRALTVKEYAERPGIIAEVFKLP